MRIVGLTVSGFRGFARTYEFDLSAEATVIVGPNGTGKTSLFDAILWTLTGKVARIGSAPKSVISMYSETGEAYAKVDLESHKGEFVSVSRRFDGTKQTFQFEANGSVARDEIGLAQMLDLVWPQALGTDSPLDALTTAITRSVYLQQDLVREFAEGLTPADRFNALSELLGSGRMTELQAQLERAKRSWTGVTNNLEGELAELQRRVFRLESDLAELSETAVAADAISDEWLKWWADLGAAGLSIVTVPNPDAVDAPQAIDTAIKQLLAASRSTQRRLEDVDVLMSEVASGEKVAVPDTLSLQNRVRLAEEAVSKARAELIASEQRAAESRRRLVHRRAAREELSTLARLALRHMDEHCPVCGQVHDIGTTKARLEAMITEVEVSLVVDDGSTVAANYLEITEKELLTLQAQLAAARESQRQIEAERASREHRFAQLSLPAAGPATADALLAEVLRLQERRTNLSQLQARGEALALAIARAGESARRVERQRELTASRRQLDKARRDIEARTKTGNFAQLVIDQLRSAGSVLVSSQLDSIQPLLQKIYGRVDPHPTLRTVRLLSSFPRGHGQVAAEVSDIEMPQVAVAPGAVLSSSQSNALAVSIFLTLNLGLPAVPISAALLDDPLQSLDDVNLLGLIDLLKRTKDRRQLILSTHDRRFGQLLIRKLRPVSQDQRTRLIEFKSWDRSGPTIDQTDVVPQRLPLQVVA
jgi:DNA repair exonuclease SbcCD ATPase subunit